MPATLKVTVPTGASIVATATNSSGDTSALSTAVTVTNPFAVINTNASGPGSLEQAILNVNADTGNPNPDTITFAIGSGAQTITLTSVLTASSHPVIIDGTTQPGFAGTPLITIDGGALSGSILTLGAGSTSSTIRGLAFTDFAGDAIEVDTNTDLVQSNSIAVASSGASGVLVKGTQDTVQSNSIQVTGSGATGVLVKGAQDTVGGSVASAGNTISYGNGDTAIDASGGTKATIRANLLTTSGTTGTAIASDGAERRLRSLQPPPAAA